MTRAFKIWNINGLCVLAQNHLRVHQIFVKYYLTNIGTKCKLGDFILNKEEAVEVKIKPTRQNSQRLKKISQELDMKKAYLVSKKYSALGDIKYGFML